jgi:hypothetical protein
MFNFKNAVVKSGSKLVDESKAILSLASTYNSFGLNKKAMALLGVGVGEKVVLFDVKDEATDQNSRFFICKGFEVNGKEMGATITKGQSFSYSIVYGAMLAQDANEIALTPQQLIDRGLLYEKDSASTSQYVSTKTAECELVAVNDGQPVEVADGVEEVVYMITNFNFSDHTKKVMTKKADTTDVVLEELEG